MNRLITIVFLASAAAPGRALAANLLVDPSGGGASTTISGGIALAEDGDNIRVSAGTYYETLDTAGKDLTIESIDGAATTVIDGNGSGVLLTVSGGERVVVEGITFRDAEGAVSVDDSVLSLRNVTITRTNGTAVVLGNGASVTVLDSNISFADGADNNGGGFKVRHSALTLNGVNITESNAVRGGGLYGYNANLSIVDATFSTCSATANGGAIHLSNGSRLSADLLVIEDSTAPLGGGMYAEEAELEWSDGAVDRNSTPGDGGGVWLGLVSTARIGASFSGNSADGSGGAIYLDDSELGVTGDLTDNSAADGGGIWAQSGALSLTGATLARNSGVSGGAINVRGSAAATAQSSSFNNNTASNQGGAIYATGELTLRECTFSGNSAGNVGGAIWGGNMTITGGLWESNSSKNGGALSSNGALVIVSGASFDGNEARDAGGAIYHYGAGKTARIVDAGFSGNVAPDGAAFFATDSDSASISDTTVTGSVGSAIASSVTPLTLSDLAVRGSSDAGVSSLLAATLTVDGLSLEDNGVGLHTDAADALIERSVVLNNGVGLSLSGAGAVVNNIQLLGNGAGLIADNSDAVLTNVDWIGNDIGGELIGGSTSVVNALLLLNPGGSLFADKVAALSVTYSDLWANGDKEQEDPLTGLVGESGNISADPLFLDFSDDGDWGNDVFFLTPKSPAIDAGDPKIFDLDETRSDMGSYGGPGATSLDADGDGYPTSKGDCDDEDPTISPGAEEIWYDGIDQNCDGADDYDQDGDGYYHESSGFTDPEVLDCDDTDPETHIGADDPEGDRIDQNCDGVDGTAVTGGDDWDGDGFSTAEGDCNDDDSAINPVVPEQCYDARDNNCDGFIDQDDEACTTGGGKGCGCAQLTSGGLPSPGSLLPWLLLLPLISSRRSRAGAAARG